MTGKRGRKRKPIERRRLVFDDIELLPVEDARKIPQHLLGHTVWHLPGGKVASTGYLVKRAERLGVTIKLHETVNGQSRATSLI